MKINTNLLEDLKVLALSGTHPKVWVSSALVHRNKIISYGVNRMKTHPYQMKFGRNKESIFWHAETSALYTADKRFGFDKFHNSILYIARVKYDSTQRKNFVSGLAAPCDGCLRCIKKYGIKTVIYTVDNNEDCNETFGVMML